MKDMFKNHPDLKIFGEVFLHGSRGMVKRELFSKREHLVKNSDWDYAAQHHQPWEKHYSKIIAHGWEEIETKSYGDSNTAFVFEKTIDGQKVQVSLRHDIDLYKHCVYSVDYDFYWKYLWKGSEDCMPVEYRKCYWNSLYYAYGFGKMEGSNWE